MKVIVTYPPEYKTPVMVQEVETLEDAYEIIDEAKQGFGMGVVITDEEFDKMVEYKTKRK